MPCDQDQGTLCHLILVRPIRLLRHISAQLAPPPVRHFGYYLDFEDNPTTFSSLFLCVFLEREPLLGLKVDIFGIDLH